MTLLERLRALYPEASGRSLKQWLEAGRVEVNGHPARDGRLALAAGDTVTLAARHAAPFPRGLSLVHEDDAILVVVKPSGLLSIATDRERERTAYRMLWDLIWRPSGAPVHRPPARPRDLGAPRRRQDARGQACAAGAVRRADGGSRLRRGGGRRDTQTSGHASRARSRRTACSGCARPRGAQAITRYRVRERGRDATLIDIALGTGRRHQIRVQLAAIGHPVVGDAQHGSRRDPLGRVCLHASVLGFVHPSTGEAVRFERPAPPAFARLVQGV